MNEWNCRLLLLWLLLLLLLFLLLIVIHFNWKCYYSCCVVLLCSFATPRFFCFIRSFLIVLPQPLTDEWFKHRIKRIAKKIFISITFCKKKKKRKRRRKQKKKMWRNEQARKTCWFFTVFFFYLICWFNS